jgi:hypothetical protein
MAIPAKTIDEVITELDLIIDSTVADNNFLGIFAYVYRRTTAQIKQAIREQQFEDNARMELMDVAFANLYLTAFHNYANNKNCSASWQAAFSAKHEKITILQHVMLGMNAHINLDLGIAAAIIAPGNELAGIKNDFMKVNQILNELTNEMQQRVAKVSGLMFILDWTGNNTDERFINFSMIKARQQAWNLAGILANLSEAEKEPAISVADQAIAGLANLLKSPKSKLVNLILKFIAKFEEKDVKKIIDMMKEDR